MKNWITGIISIAAIIIAIIALANVAPTHGIDFDYMGVIIGVLSFLVTLLIGYQIYTVINVKDELKEIQKLRAEIDNTIDDKIKKASEVTDEELNNIIPLLIALDMRNNVEIVATSLEVFNDARENSLAYTFSDGLIFTFMNIVATYGEKEQEDFLGQLKERTQYDYVGRFYGHMTTLTVEDREGFEGTERMMLKLVNKFVTV